MSYVIPYHLFISAHCRCEIASSQEVLPNIGLFPASVQPRYYDYDPGRGQEVHKHLLAGLTGYLQTDGYDGYNAVVALSGLTHVGCMTHARRKFSEAVKA